MRYQWDRPLHRLFSYRACLTPFSVEAYTYQAGTDHERRWSYAYVFGLRVASWNSYK